MIDLLKIPLSVRSIPFIRYCSYMDSEDRMFRAGPDNTDDQTYYCADSICAITGWDIDEVLETIPLYTPGDNYKEMVGNYIMQLGDEISLFRLSAHIQTLIANYREKKRKLKTFKFKIGDELFYLDNGLVETIFLDNSIEALPAGEMILVLDARKRLSTRGESYLAANDFNLGLDEVALLCKKKGERIPVLQRGRVEFIKSRHELFKEQLMLNTVLDLRFFLIRSLEGLVKKGFLTSFGTGGPTLGKGARSPLIFHVKNRSGSARALA